MTLQTKNTVCVLRAVKYRWEKNMKKIISLILAAALAFSVCACGAASDAMSYSDYKAADLDAAVTIETNFQAAQAWWEKNGVGVASIYAEDKDGAYFLYECKCSKEDYDKLVPGTRIRVTGYKAEWSGEVEVSDGTLEIVKGSKYVAKAEDVTSLLGKDELIDKQNRFISMKGLKVEKAALYKWDGSGSAGDDLYFDVSLNGNTYTFTVESYLCGKDTDVYKAVEGLKVGDVIDLEGFLYWYNGAQPHVTKVTVK